MQVWLIHTSPVGSKVPRGSGFVFEWTLCYLNTSNGSWKCTGHVNRCVLALYYVHFRGIHTIHVHILLCIIVGLCILSVVLLCMYCVYYCYVCILPSIVNVYMCVLLWVALVYVSVWHVHVIMYILCVRKSCNSSAPRLRDLPCLEPSKAPGCSIPSTVRVLLGAWGFPNMVGPAGRGA